MNLLIVPLLDSVQEQCEQMERQFWQDWEEANAYVGGEVLEVYQSVINILLEELSDIQCQICTLKESGDVSL